MIRCTKFLIFIAINALVFMLMVQPFEASRILEEEEEQWMKRGQDLLLPSFQRGRPTGPPSPSGCTYTPGGGGKPCTASISNQNFAGISHPSPPAASAYPKQMLQFGVATQSK
ncbi:hypothetical protein C2S52_017746 [Perilla frutescens var. hirtella]|nr:hypothetical protein C2S52_017746 [Perilla frutescens var. hirtella]KAH6811499.1 hypothetical protein C2S51_025261 [Perilla frutescens var. frutescens]